MKAVNHFVVISRVKEPKKKTGGLIITDDTNDDVRYFKGNVISVGNLVEGISDGDLVWYDRHSGHGIEFEDKFYFVIRASDIVLVD